MTCRPVYRAAQYLTVCPRLILVSLLISESQVLKGQSHRAVLFWPAMTTVGSLCPRALHLVVRNVTVHASTVCMSMGIMHVCSVRVRGSPCTIGRPATCKSKGNLLCVVTNCTNASPGAMTQHNGANRYACSSKAGATRSTTMQQHTVPCYNACNSLHVWQGSCIAQHVLCTVVAASRGVGITPCRFTSDTKCYGV